MRASGKNHLVIMLVSLVLGKQILARRLIAGLAALICLGLWGCTNADFVRPKLPATPDLVGSNPYGVIKVMYAKGFAETNTASMVLCLHRAGDQVEILKRSLAQEKINGVLEYWYQVKSQDQLSWIFGAWMDQFPLEIQAKTAAVIIRDKMFARASSINPQ